MKSPKHKAALIISVYDNIENLRAILDSVAMQTEKDFEIIISEDGENPAMKAFVDSYPFSNDHIHLTQPDEGWRKNRALNNAIRHADSDWLIFIDGDCVLHRRFVEQHLRFSGPDRYLSGKRAYLSPRLSLRVIEDPSVITNMQRWLLCRLFFSRECKKVKRGIYYNPTGPLWFIPKLHRAKTILGSNMSFPREALLRINGFDEDYRLPAVGEDDDLKWRLDALGYRMRSVRNYAVQYHLWHKPSWSDRTENLKIYDAKIARNEYIAVNGLIKPGENE